MRVRFIANRNCNGHWMDRLVWIATKKASIRMENIVISIFGGHITFIGSK